MHGDTICERIMKFLGEVEEGKGTAEDVEKIRVILDDWDPYASWGEDR